MGIELKITAGVKSVVGIKSTEFGEELFDEEYMLEKENSSSCRGARI